ncbi:MAG: hypothetical protein IJ626_01840 [Muribaculaceae bacterium]|nr:hypothetical protein [Muribaculaceae bacterium]
MKRFVNKVFWFAVLLASVFIALIFFTPPDENSYLSEYNHKLQLLSHTPGQRIIFVGGSSVAFGNDSQTISDSLGMPVINFGLHAGIGIKYPLTDCLSHVHKGDVVVAQIEYPNFYTGGNGEASTLALFMNATGWRGVTMLNLPQWIYVIRGIPRLAWGNLVRLVKYPFTGNINQDVPSDEFKYRRSGFNRWGDEVSHYELPAGRLQLTGKTEDNKIDPAFMDWLDDCFRQFEQRGAQVIILPPVCCESYFSIVNDPSIAQAMDAIGRPFAAPMKAMVLSDSCSYDYAYHVTREGVRQNSLNIIRAIKPILNRQNSGNK